MFDKRFCFDVFVFLLFTETLNGTNAINLAKKKCRHQSTILEKQRQNEREFFLFKNDPAMGQIQRGNMFDKSLAFMTIVGAFLERANSRSFWRCFSIIVD
jgi:hypothetical protein